MSETRELRIRYSAHHFVTEIDHGSGWVDRNHYCQVTLGCGIEVTSCTEDRALAAAIRRAFDDALSDDQVMVVLRSEIGDAHVSPTACEEILFRRFERVTEVR